MTPFRLLLSTAPPGQVWPQCPGDIWDYDVNDGSVYCWSCGVRGLQGRVCEEVGIKPTTAKKLIGEYPRCAWCGTVTVGKQVRPRNAKKSNAGRALREITELMRQLGRMAKGR